ncbi:MAG: hypothetical protein H7321_10485 [Bacteroidia bacterium]|nr:hypothetical protein [Bacteroidia bacterium]
MKKFIILSILTLIGLPLFSQVTQLQIKGVWEIAGVAKAGSDTIFTYPKNTFHLPASLDGKRTANLPPFRTSDFSANPYIAMVNMMENNMIQFNGAGAFAKGVFVPGLSTPGDFKRATYTLVGNQLKTTGEGKDTYTVRMVGEYLVLTSKKMQNASLYFKKVSDTLY